VIADFLANRTRRLLARDDDWTALAGKIRYHVALTPERKPDLAGDDDVAPTIAHDGAARVWLEKVRRTGETLVLEPTRPRWAREQAEIWASIEEGP